MKTIPALLFLFCCFNTFSQDEKIILQGKVVNTNGDPISDVYIINSSNYEKDITLANGIFTITVSPGDSLILSHISYNRKSVQVYTLLKAPVITLESDNIEIPEITVTPDNAGDLEKAKKNLSFLKDYKVQSYTKIKPESDPVQDIMTEHNKMMRTEASSINLMQIPLESINIFSKKKKIKRKRYNSYYSTRKQKDLHPDD
ncbi:hypothetical protein OU798_00570 [Prolixibacteraceae bacterium Z1-6]|uniref:Carboxypeptidase-like regulatory domain-containing protein n=1 Tax=Draconibacterium aestuarii TaxID=2998507 RepID=A0A9X3J3Z3_9BACT|nr:hypothetical protein [Prolixibacteraceae bacterium Z1-6]